MKEEAWNTFHTQLYKGRYGAAVVSGWQRLHRDMLLCQGRRVLACDLKVMSLPSTFDWFLWILTVQVRHMQCHVLASVSVFCFAALQQDCRIEGMECEPSMKQVSWELTSSDFFQIKCLQVSPVALTAGWRGKQRYLKNGTLFGWEKMVTVLLLLSLRGKDNQFWEPHSSVAIT